MVDKEIIFNYFDEDNQKCKLCSQFIHKTNGNLFEKIFDSSFSPIIKEYNHFIWGIGIGQISEGYSLIIPKRHILSFASLNEIELFELSSIFDEINSIISNIYGEFIIFEHGMNNEIPFSKAGGCISHAHIHILPNIDFYEFHKLVSLKRKVFKVNDITYLKNLSCEYLFYASPLNKSFYVIHDSDNIESQFFRKLASQVICSEHWDWKYYIGLSLIQKSIYKYRQELNR